MKTGRITMRLLHTIALSGSLVLASAVSAQTLAEHAAAAAGATAGTAAGKTVSNALTNVFGQVDHVTATAAATKGKPTPPVKAEFAPDAKNGAAKASSGPAEGGGGTGVSVGPEPAAPRAPRARASRQRPAPVQAVALIPAPVQAPVVPTKELTLEDFANIKIGSSAQELQAALGTPESHVSVPDDDGHMRESCQYWAQGRPLGTVRLDNGQVVKIDLRREN
jgi:hypothetical protein